MSTPPPENHIDPIEVRAQKLHALREKGFAFPNDVKVTIQSAGALDAPVEEADKAKRYVLAGRIVQFRLMGKAAFFHLLDTAGKLQIYVKRDVVGDETFEAFKEFDLGDIVEVGGYVFVTKTGEKSLWAENIRLLVKALQPLPEKWHGLQDIEARYRHRYLDLVSNLEVRDTFRKRAEVIRYLRRFLDDRGYLEVETPVLNAVAGGATARPFTTHWNSLSCDMHLRVATELPLKKLVVGGLERVYEIGRVFRNEGLSRKHNPEFTTCEFYQAYATFEDLMQLTEEFMTGVVRSVCGAQAIRYGELTVDFSPPYPRVTMHESVHLIGGVGRDMNLAKLEDIHQVAAHHRIKLDEPNDWGRSIEALWGALVEPRIVNPTFITHHPFSISPLARKSPDNPLVTDRFELIIAGMEMANAFSELNDAEDQRERFEEQLRRKQAGDQEAQDIEEDFLKALEHGMPPTGGEGIGIDRFVMLLTNSHSIRDVLLFPQLKPVPAIDPAESAANE